LFLFAFWLITADRKRSIFGVDMTKYDDDFKEQWDYNLVRLTAEHRESGAVIHFVDNKDGSFDGKVINKDAVPGEWYPALAGILRLVGEEMAKKLQKKGR
jgi:hypothetical protein